MKSGLTRIFKVSVMAWCFAVLAALFLVLLGWEKIDRASERDNWKQDSAIFKDTIAQQALIGPQEAKLKYIDFYNKIIGWYGGSYHPTPERSRGMHGKTRAIFIVKCYEYTKILDLPPMALMSLAFMESSYNPNATGPFEEGGIFQMRWAAVAQATYFYEKWLTSPAVKKTLRFDATKWDDLYDPLNQLKMAAVLLWGYKRMFGNDERWYIPAYHWGSGLIMKYYRNDVLPPDEFVFNKGTINEDVRNPWSYYFVWAQVNQAFSHFRKDINVPTDYVKKYMAQASKLEQEFIESWKYVKKLYDTLDRMERKEKEFEDYMATERRRLKGITEKAYKKHAELNALIKVGKFRKVSDVFHAGEALSRKLAKDIAGDAVRSRDKVAFAAFAGAAVIAGLFSLFGIFVTARGGFRWIGRRWRNRHHGKMSDRPEE